MGFKAPKKLYRLTFADDTDLAGLEVTMSSVPMGSLLEIQQLTGSAEDVAQDMTGFHRMIEIFTGAMLSWNLEDDFDQPVPTTPDGVLTLDPDVIMVIIAAWTKAISGVSDPLDAGSTSGPTSLEASLPMEPLSPNPAS